MVATVNASTSAGVVITPDNSGVLAFQSSSATALTIDASQNATFAGTATATKLIPTGTSATGNGLYLPAANSLGLSTNGTNAVYIDSTQNVGIGATPNSKLYIRAATNANLRVTDASGTLNLSAENDAGSAQVAMKFNGSQMMLDASGNLLVGQTTQTGNEKFGVTQSAATSFAAYFNATAGNYGYDVVKIKCARGSATNEYNFINCLQVSSVVFQVLASGNVQNTNNSYGAISDIKLKENIVDATPKLADLMQVKVRNYNLKSDPTHKQIGVIAQELEQVFPAMVEEATDKDEEGNSLETTTKSVKYSVFVPMLIKSIQELKAINDTLTARIVALENR